MEFKKVKKYLITCGEDFASCVSVIATNTSGNDSLLEILSSATLPDLLSAKGNIKFISFYELEFRYIKSIIDCLLSLKKEEAKVIWENYFYIGKKELLYERTVDYRHRVRASNKFYNNLQNL